MLNANPLELETIYRTAVESAALLRRSGETAKAGRVESLARIVARQLARVGAGCGAGVLPTPGFPVRNQGRARRPHQTLRTRGV